MKKPVMCRFCKLPVKNHELSRTGKKYIGRAHPACHYKWYAERYGRDTTYRSWASCKAACNLKTSTGYANYGAAGIKFEFDSVDDLIAEIGERPAGKSLGRIDKSKNFCKGNVGWFKHSELTKNRKSCKLSINDVLKIRTMAKAGFSGPVIASIFGVYERGIRRIVSGGSWRDI